MAAAGKIAYIEGWAIYLPDPSNADKKIPHVIRRDAKITLNGAKAFIGDLNNGDNVTISGESPEVHTVEATRPEAPAPTKRRKTEAETPTPTPEQTPPTVTHSSRSKAK